MRSIIVAVALVSSVSLAQQPEQQAAPKRPQVQKVIFGDDLLEGGRVTPMSDIYLVPPKKKFDCLIKVRMNFNDKLAESVHEM